MRSAISKSRESFCRTKGRTQYGLMLKDQIETTETAEEMQAAIENGYANKL